MGYVRCEECGTPFEDTGRKIFCSRRCLSRHHSKKKTQRTIEKKKKEGAPLCECGCGEYVTRKLRGQWNKYKPGHRPGPHPGETAPLCACRCGQPVEWNVKHCRWNKYIKGHEWNDPEFRHRRHGEAYRNKGDAPLCECGCMQPVTWRSRCQRWNRYLPGHHWNVSENRQRQSEVQKEVWADLERREALSIATRDNWKDPDIRERRLNGLRHVLEDPEYLERRKQGTRRAMRDPDFRRRQSDTMKRVMGNPEVRRRLSQAQKRRSRDPEYLRKQSEASIRTWANAEIRARRLKGLKRSFCGSRSLGREPNRLECLFDSITPDCVHYVGDGSWWRTLPNGKHKNPDFIIEPIAITRKVLEVHGDYWHKGEDTEDLVGLFAGIGYDCLVIWEHEIHADIDGVLDRVADFIGQEEWQMELSLVSN